MKKEKGNIIYIDNISTPQWLLFYLFTIKYPFAIRGINLWTNIESADYR